MMAETAIHAVRVALGRDEPATQTTPRERESLRKHADGKHRALEIGVFEGASTVLIAQALAPDGRLLAIDPFLRGRLGVSWGRFITERTLRRHHVRSRVDLCRDFSWNVALHPSETFDFAFIDGDHSADGVRRDWNDWSGRIEMDGIVALHDTQAVPERPDLRTLGSFRVFQSEIISDPRFAIIEVADSLSVLRRVSP